MNRDSRPSRYSFETAKWFGPLFGKVIRETEKAVLIEKDRLVNYNFMLPRQWIPKKAFRLGDSAGVFYIAKWFIKSQELKISAGVPLEEKISSPNTKVEVPESFSGRRRLLRPEVSPAEQKKINERKFEQAKQERFYGNVDKVLAKILEKDERPIDKEAERRGIPPEEILREGWSRRHNSGDPVAFVCEASNNPKMCPKCKKAYPFPSKDVIMMERDQEGEILAWHYKHSCGASLIVLND